jgi:methionyl aminopeptidase
MIQQLRKLQLEESERCAMRAAGRFNARLMDHLRPFVKPGVTTNQLDRIIAKYTADHGHRAASLGYMGPKGPFPKSCCTSVNDIICHGIPGPYVLKEGDIVNIDVTTVVDGWHGDSSETFLVGQVSRQARAVTQCALDALWAAIDAIGPGSRVSEIGQAIMARARLDGFGVVSEYVGHGVGREFHQKPSIPHGPPTSESRSERLYPGICFTIEPMINAGSRRTLPDKRDGWTVRTKDGSLSAQFEHTVLMTEDGPEVLTLTKCGPQRGHKF